MNPGDTYRYAARTVRSIGRQQMAPADWEQFGAAVSGLRVAVGRADLPGVARIAGTLATLSDNRQRAKTDPKLIEQPTRTRSAADELTRRLEQLAAEYQQSTRDGAK